MNGAKPARKQVRATSAPQLGVSTSARSAYAPFSRRNAQTVVETGNLYASRSNRLAALDNSELGKCTAKPCFSVKAALSRGDGQTASTKAPP